MKLTREFSAISTDSRKLQKSSAIIWGEVLRQNEIKLVGWLRKLLAANYSSKVILETRG